MFLSPGRANSEVGSELLLSVTSGITRGSVLLRPPFLSLSPFGGVAQVLSGAPEAGKLHSGLVLTLPRIYTGHSALTLKFSFLINKMGRKFQVHFPEHRREEVDYKGEIRVHCWDCYALLPTGIMDTSFHPWWFLGMRVGTFPFSILSSILIMGLRNSCGGGGE